MSDFSKGNFHQRTKSFPSLFFVHAGNIRFGMGLDPTGEAKVLAYIELCKSQQDIVWFTDCNGVNHAAIEANQIKRTESFPKPVDGGTLGSDDFAVEYHLYYQDGRIGLLESGYEDHFHVCSHLTYALKEKEEVQVDQVVGGVKMIGADLVGYTSTAGISCFCPTNKLLLSGCPSSLGKHCVTKLATTPKRWK